MATTQGRQGTGKSAGSSSGTRKSASGTGSRKAQSAKKVSSPMNRAIRREIILIVLLALAVFLFLCNFHIIGKVGDAISGFLFGVFGLMAYVVPILFFLAVAFAMFHRNSRIAVRKIVAICVLLFALAMVFELIDAGYTSTDTYHFAGIYQRCRTDRAGGGIIAGSVTFAFYKLLGMVGTILALLVIAIICIIIITERSLISGMANRGREAYERNREAAPDRREQARLRRERREQEREEERRERMMREEEEETETLLRMDRKVNGVMLDTSLTRTHEKDRDDIHEIMMDEDWDGSEDDSEQWQDESYSAHAISHSDDMDEVYWQNDDGEDDAVFDDDRFYAENVTGASEPAIHRERPKAVASTGTASAAASAVATGSMQRENVGRTSAGAGKVQRPYRFPPLSKLNRPTGKSGGASDKVLKETALRLQKTLENFGVKVTVTDIMQGPAVTRYELQPEQGVKVSKIVGLADDIKLNLAATDIRIEAPIPGKAAVGIEVPNKENTSVTLRELLETEEFKKFPSNLAFAVGKDIAGQTVVADIAKMPHMLIAGATGSGKSVCINTIIMSILYKAHPDDVKLIMIDPKVVELSVYNGIPHLLQPVVTDPKKAAAALQWGVAEMTDRYRKFADMNVRDLKGYNKKVESMADDPDAPQKLPQILIIVDELADLMMVAAGEVEEAICRLAQLARACGIHLVIATQRPSVDVITGLIKANMPSRVAFAVSSGVDSRTILDMNGAEKLLGKGDMLFYPQGYPRPVRIQGAFVSDREVSDVVDFLKEQSYGHAYSEEIAQQIAKLESAGQPSGGGAGVSSGSEYDPYFVEAGRFIIDKDKASIGMLQRVFKIGFNRAARIMDQLCEAGVVGEEEGTKPRKILMSPEEFEQLAEEIM